MSPKSITLQHIYDLQLDTAGKVGDLHGRINSLEVEVRGTRSAVGEQGKATAALQQVCSQRGDHCERRFKRISEAVHGVSETTGVVQLDGIKRAHTFKVLCKVGAAVLAVATVVAAFWGALSSCNPAQAVSVPIPVVVPVEKHSKQLGRVEHNQDVLMSEMGKLGWFSIGNGVKIPTLAAARRVERGRSN